MMTKSDTTLVLRQFVLLLCGFVTVVTPVELWLVSHTQKVTQLIPFGLLLANFVFVTLMFRQPTTFLLRAYRWFAALLLLGAMAGVGFHLKGNFEIATEVNPELTGLSLLLEVLRGANPVLAPGLFVQIAALGFIFTFRHPILEASQQSDADSRGISTNGKKPKF